MLAASSSSSSAAAAAAAAVALRLCPLHAAAAGRRGGGGRLLLLVRPLTRQPPQSFQPRRTMASKRVRALARGSPGFLLMKFQKIQIHPYICILYHFPPCRGAKVLKCTLFYCCTICRAVPATSPTPTTLTSASPTPPPPQRSRPPTTGPPGGATRTRSHRTRPRRRQRGWGGSSRGSRKRTSGFDTKTILKTK